MAHERVRYLRSTLLLYGLPRGRVLELSDDELQDVAALIGTCTKEQYENWQNNVAGYEMVDMSHLTVEEQAARLRERMNPDHSFLKRMYGVKPDQVNTNGS